MERPGEIQALIDMLNHISDCMRNRGPMASTRRAKVTLKDMGFSHDVKMNVELQGPKWRRKERMMNSVMKGLKEMEEYGYAPSIPVQISFAMMMVILTYSC